MTDDAPRVLTEEERARAQAARARGGMCALCGRALAPDEPVWIERVGAYGDGGAYWRVPVGRECASPAFVSEPEGAAPAPCVGCGRPVYSRSTHPRQRVAACSRRCRERYHNARARERTSS